MSWGTKHTELAAPDSQKSIYSLSAWWMRRSGMTYHSLGSIGLGRIGVCIDIDILGCVRCQC